MDQARIQRRSRRKKAALAAAVVLALALAGTFAWANYTQLALNEAMSSAQQGGRLHDDFTFATASASNKDVYVENFTDKETGGVPIYARVRFLEYMEKGTNAGKNNSSATSVADTGVQPGTKPDRNVRSTWTLHHFEPVDGTDEDFKFREFWDWKYGDSSDGSTVYMPTFNKNKDSFEADVNGSMSDTPTPYCKYTTYTVNQPLKDNASYDADDDTTDEAGGNYNSNNGLKKDGTTRLSGTGGVDGTDYRIHEEEHKAANTLLTQQVVSMAAWTAAGGNPGNFWVYDTDGWAYWANPIDPGTATGLLLTNIAPRAIGDDWYYGIEAQAQFATIGEWKEIPAGGATDPTYTFTDTANTTSGDMKDGNTMTEGAWNLLEKARENDSSVKDAPSNDFELTLTSTPAPDDATKVVAIDAGGEVTLTASATREAASRAVENADVDYSWSVTPASGVGSFEGATDASTAKLKIDPAAYDGEATVTVTATTNDDSDPSKALTKTSSVKVKVNPRPPVPPATAGIAATDPGSTTPVKLDLDGDGTPDTDFYVLAKKSKAEARVVDGGGCDEEGTYGLVLAKDIVEDVKFSDSSNKWKGSNAETWCNNYFDTKVKGSLHDLVPKVELSTQAAAGSESAVEKTEDNVFFLSAQDVFGQYMDASNNGVNSSKAELYTAGEAKPGQGIVPSTLRVAVGGTYNYWLLRSPGNTSIYAAGVNSYGNLSTDAHFVSDRSARPAFWVYLGA